MSAEVKEGPSFGKRLHLAIAGNCYESERWHDYIKGVLAEHWISSHKDDVEIKRVTLVFAMICNNDVLRIVHPDPDKRTQFINLCNEAWSTWAQIVNKPTAKQKLLSAFANCSFGNGEQQS